MKKPKPDAKARMKKRQKKLDKQKRKTNARRVNKGFKAMQGGFPAGFTPTPRLPKQAPVDEVEETALVITETPTDAQPQES